MVLKEEECELPLLQQLVTSTRDSIVSDQNCLRFENLTRYNFQLSDSKDLELISREMSNLHVMFVGQSMP